MEGRDELPNMTNVFSIQDKEEPRSLLDTSPFIKKNLVHSIDVTPTPNTIYRIDTSALEISLSKDEALTHVFDMFKKENQFELLLDKLVEKTPEIKVSLFNYIKKNPVFYPKLMQNTSLLHEIARSLEASATRRLNVSAKHKLDLKEKIGSEHDSYTDNLNQSLTELVDASDCYAKAICHKKSNQCEKRAKLVALQLHLMNRGIFILDLSTSELTDLIAKLESFHEAYIISEAYDFHLVWRKALFDNVILRSDITYLNDYCRKYDLPSFLIEELVLLYKQYINNHELSTEDRSKLAKSMKTILARLPEIEIKFKIYTQLNFENAKSELLSDPITKAILNVA